MLWLFVTGAVIALLLTLWAFKKGHSSAYLSWIVALLLFGLHAQFVSPLIFAFEEAHPWWHGSALWLEHMLALVLGFLVCYGVFRLVEFANKKRYR